MKRYMNLQNIKNTFHKFMNFLVKDRQTKAKVGGGWLGVTGSNTGLENNYHFLTQYLFLLNIIPVTEKSLPRLC